MSFFAYICILKPNEMDKKTNTLLLFSLFSIIFALPCRAELQVRSFQLSSEQGLGASYVRSIVQDSKGYIWMGATNGLIRYDGYSSELITPSDKENRRLMLDERVQTVDTWLDRFILLRLRGRKYSCYDTQTGRFVDYTGNSSYNESYHDYHILRDGSLWLTNEDGTGKVMTFDGNAFSCRKMTKGEKLPQEAVPTLPNQYAHLLTADKTLLTDNRGNLIVSSIYGELWHINKTTLQLTHLTGIFSEELVRLNGTPRYSIVTDKDGIIWVSTSGNGLFAHNPKTGETTHFLKRGANLAPIQTNFLLNIYEDKAGNIWACQENMGVSCISKQRMDIETLFFTDADNIDHSNSIHLLTHVGGQIWIGNRYNTLMLADGMLGNRQIVNKYKDDIVAVCSDLRGTTWLGTRQSGVFVGNQNLRHNSSAPASLSEGKVSDIVCDRQGRIWVSIFEKGVDLAVPDEKGGYTFRHFFQGKHAVMRPRQMLVDYKGNIWLCSNEGLYVFNPDKLIADESDYLHLNTDARDSNTDEIHCIYEDRTHCILAGTTGGGLAEFDNRNDQPVFLRRYTTEDGLPNDNVQQIIQDLAGNVWVGTDMGLACYNREGKRFMSLNPANTLQGNMFIEHAACRLDDGRLAFGTHHGIIILNPLTISPRMPLFPLRITGIDINGVSIYDMEEAQIAGQLEEGKTISLNHNQNTIIFRFSDFEYTEGITSRYMYRLKGYDDNWSKLSDYNTTIFRNLPPGTYTMEVRAQNSNGVWNETTAVQTIVIQPPYWATWWAYLLYILLGMALGIVIYRQLKRVNALRNRIKVEQELTAFKIQFFTNISHEFRTPLTIIRGAMERIQHAGKIPGELKQPLFSMQKSSDRLLRMVNQLMAFSQIHENKLHLGVEETEVVAFVRDIFSTFRGMAETKHISYQFAASAPKIITLVDRSFLDKIVYNLISNAFKYTPSHHDITVRVKEGEQQLLLVVEDTGVGIPKEKQKELFERFNQSAFSRDSIGIGLHLTNELVRAHHGTIKYDENPKGGSIFTISLPMDAKAYNEKELMHTDNAVAKEEEENLQPQTIAEYREMAPIPINKRHILIVDDDSDVMAYLQHELQHYFIVTSAHDGKEALEMIEQDKPELVVSDVAMPVMNGLELIRHIRSNSEWNDIPVILLTAMTSEEDELKGIKSGAEAYLRKPFSPSLLVAKISRLLEQRDKLKVTYAKEIVGNVAIPNVLTNEADRRLREQMEAWMNAHISDTQVTAESFASSMGLGRSVFFKKMKQLFGMTPNDYIRNVRMKEAAELLLTTNLTAAEIAYKTGFEDQYYFSKSFKKYYGQPPSQYRHGKSSQD